MAPRRLRHFLFTWLKTQGIDDALIQPASRKSLEIYSRIAITRRPSDLRERPSTASRSDRLQHQRLLWGW